MNIGDASVGLPTLGETKASIDQTLDQTITGLRADGSGNTGQTLITVLAKDGPSKVFINGLDQYLTQTVSNCVACTNTGIITATFAVDDASTFTLRDNSFQTLTQYASRDGVMNQNTLNAVINVAGAGTTANILLQQQLTNNNMDTQGNIDFQASYASGNNMQQCIFNSPGVYTQANCING